MSKPTEDVGVTLTVTKMVLMVVMKRVSRRTSTKILPSVYKCQTD